MGLSERLWRTSLIKQVSGKDLDFYNIPYGFQVDFGIKICKYRYDAKGMVQIACEVFWEVIRPSQTSDSGGWTILEQLLNDCGQRSRPTFFLIKKSYLDPLSELAL